MCSLQWAKKLAACQFSVLSSNNFSMSSLTPSQMIMLIKSLHYVPLNQLLCPIPCWPESWHWQPNCSCESFISSVGLSWMQSFIYNRFTKYKLHVDDDVKLFWVLHSPTTKITRTIITVIVIFGSGIETVDPTSKHTTMTCFKASRPSTHLKNSWDLHISRWKSWSRLREIRTLRPPIEHRTADRHGYHTETGPDRSPV